MTNDQRNTGTNPHTTNDDAYHQQVQDSVDGSGDGDGYDAEIDRVDKTENANNDVDDDEGHVDGERRIRRASDICCEDGDSGGNGPPTKQTLKVTKFVFLSFSHVKIAVVWRYFLRFTVIGATIVLLTFFSATCTL